MLQRQAAAATAAAAAARAEEEQKVVIRPARRPAVKPLRLRSPSSSDESEEEDSPSTRYRGVLPVDPEALIFVSSLLSCLCALPTPVQQGSCTQAAKASNQSLDI